MLTIKACYLCEDLPGYQCQTWTLSFSANMTQNAVLRPEYESVSENFCFSSLVISMTRLYIARTQNLSAQGIESSFVANPCFLIQKSCPSSVASVYMCTCATACGEMHYTVESESVETSFSCHPTVTLHGKIYQGKVLDWLAAFQMPPWSYLLKDNTALCDLQVIKCKSWVSCPDRQGEWVDWPLMENHKAPKPCSKAFHCTSLTSSKNSHVYQWYDSKP